MNRRWLIAPVLLLAAAGAVYVAALHTASPAPDHPFFARQTPGTQVIAHRGGARLRPENTLAAFAHAAQLGADILETDLRSTADGEIVCLHDATVDRTTDGKGEVAFLTLGELSRLDAGYRWSEDGGRTHPFRGKGIGIPTLAEVLQALPGMRMVMEMKPAEPSFAASLCALIRRQGAANRVLVASFDHEAIRAFRSACPEVATSLSAREARILFALYRWGLARAYSPSAPALQIPDRLRGMVLPTADLLAAARERNLNVHIWTINDEERMAQLAQLGVDGIITDRPDRLLELRRKIQRRPR